MILGSFRGPKSMQNEVRKRLGNRIVNKRAQDRQKTAPRRRKTPKASKLGPTWIQEGSQNQSKIDQNSILGAQGDSKATQDAPGVPSGRKITPKSQKKRLILTPKICKKSQHPALFFNGFGWENRRMLFCFLHNFDLKIGGTAQR